ncbi:MAG: hypothetical protein COB78_11940 [Hyphomicrobiales bacterium]|nr:MAG: hypothetical protein COB78_11940 [Hyphomicrobiales bacterium]
MASIKNQNLSAAVQLVAPVEKLYYLDSQSIPFTTELTALEAWNRVMAQPMPVMKMAFWVRDAISHWFGVKRISGFSGIPRADVKTGDHLDFFLVEDIKLEVLCLTARDKHLDVMTCVTTDEHRLSITSSVITHNWFGQAYMFPVAFAHRLIVRKILTRLQKNLTTAVSDN